MILTTLFKNLFKKRSVRSRRSKEHQHQQSITSSAQHQQQQQQTSTSYTATTKSGSFVTTPTSSTSNGQKKIIDGRVYHDREGISYIMPEDDEDKDRLHQQHWMIKLAFGGNFSSPVEEQLQKGITVLDSACGPATWTLEMAHTYPQSTFHGIDIAPQFPGVIKPSNCHFQVADITERLPFPDSYFDYIHQRLLVVALTKDGWNNCLAELKRVLKPGGWVEFNEVDIDNAAKIGGPAMNRLWVIFAKFIRDRGMVPEIGVELPGLLKNLGFEDVRSRAVGIAALDGTKVGELVWDDFVSIFDAIRPLLQKMYPDEFGTPEQFAKYIEDVRQETLSKIDPRPGLWYAVCARKPL